MKQVIQNFRSGRLVVSEVPETICKQGGILVDNVASLISAGTEKMVIDLAQKSLIGKAKERPDLVRQIIGKLRRDGVMSTLQTIKARLEIPLALGYSCAGIVREVGHGAEEFNVNDRVACAGMNYASHAETVFIPKNLAVKIPESVSFEEAAFVTLGAIALQGVRISEVKLGDSAAVIGLGLLGQLTVQILKAAGCRVIGIDIERNRVEIARAHGADLSIQRHDEIENRVREFTDDHGVDAVIITAATESNDPMELAGIIARDRAIISMVGAVRMEVPRKTYYEKELQLRLSRSYGPGRYDPHYEERGVDYPVGYVRWTERRNMGEFLRLVSAKSVRLDQLITHRFAIERAEMAYDLIKGKAKEEYLGILLIYDEAREGNARHRTVRLGGERVSKEIRLGLIGAGNFAKSVLLPRLAKTPRLGLVALATATGRNARAMAEKYGFGFCSTDYRELLSHDEIDTVVIATRHDTHAGITAEAVRAGKTVFVEKPLAITMDGLQEVVEAVEQTNGRVMTGFNRRFSELSTELKGFIGGTGPLAITYRINAGAIPKESWIQGDEGGGRIIGEVCHFIDYLQYLTDAEPVEVFAYRNAAGIDTVSLIVRLSDGSTGNINYFTTGDRAFPKERIEVYGSGRVAVLDDFRKLEKWRGGRSQVTKRMSQDKGFDRELSSFIQSVLTGGEMPITWRSIVLTTLTTLKIADALGSGKPQPVTLRFEI